MFPWIRVLDIHCKLYCYYSMNLWKLWVLNPWILFLCPLMNMLWCWHYSVCKPLLAILFQTMLQWLLPSKHLKYCLFSLLKQHKQSFCWSRHWASKNKNDVSTRSKPTSTTMLIWCFVEAITPWSRRMQNASLLKWNSAIIFQRMKVCST